MRRETRDAFQRHWDAVFPPAHKTKKREERSTVLESGLELNHSADSTTQSTDHAGSSSSNAAPAEEGIAMRTKRRRSSQGAESTTTDATTTTTTTRRKTRRQSIVGVVHFPSTPEPNASDGVARNSSKSKKNTTPLSTRRSPRRPLTRETTSDVCQLCFSDSAVVIMEPCAHSVCVSCWGRLAHTKETDADRAQCPWDRESVTRRGESN